MKTLFTLALMTFALTAQADPSFDRKLNKEELARLLPLYVSIVERTAGTLPSADERTNIRISTHQAVDPIYGLFKDGKYIGQQSHDMETIIRGLENLVQELKEVTPAQRLQQAADLVGGFKGTDGEAGRISCQLGYYRAGKMADERIVKCVDDRTYDGQGDEEGYVDVRSILLSIDATTLAPLSVLELDHFTAG